MPNLLKQLGHFLVKWYYWILDYFYIGFWQVLGFLRHGDAKVFLNRGKNTKRTPVILIPGIYERWEFLKPVAKALSEAGYIIHVVEGLGYNRETVESAAQKVYEYVKKNKLTDCLIVAHSKGGLIGKYMLLRYNKEGLFKGMIALNTPFSGSLYASFFPFRSLRIFAPDSPLLKELAINNAVNHRIVSIFGVFDPHIPKGSFLEGAKNIRLQTYGHFRIVRDERVHREILRALESLSRIRSDF